MYGCIARKSKGEPHIEWGIEQGHITYIHALCLFQMSCRGGGGGKRERKKDVWDVEGGYMGVKKQKLEEQFTEQVFATRSNSHA